MSLTEQNIPESDIKRYILAEMAADDRDRFEERLFLDDELFFEAADVENRLVDSYVAGELAGDDRARFERSLTAVPGRREKIANARSLNTFIDEERAVDAIGPEPVRATIWQRISEFVGGGSPTLAYGMGAAILLLAVATGLLLLQNQRKNAELARLQEIQAKQGELQSELDRSRSHENELQSAIDAERDASGDLQDELDRERSRREELEHELGKLKNSNSAQPGPIIASAVLLPLAGGRGGQGGTVPDVRIGPETKRLSMRLDLPDDVTSDDRLTVRLNKRPIARDIAPRIAGSRKSLNISVPSANLNRGRNDLDILDTQGREVSSYGFNVVDR